jgi:CRISPR-associated protein Csm3
MRLLGYLNLTGVLTCETGLLIGGNDSFGIGEINKSMIRQSFNGNRPYIPGSSLKGKMRHLLERSLYRVKDEKDEKDGNVHSCKNASCPICHIFGAGNTDDAREMTRLIVRDSKLIFDKTDAPARFRDEKSKDELEDYLDRIAEYQRQHGSFVEIKTENVIKRTTGAADKPRRFERVPAGMKFAIEMGYRVFEGDDERGVNRDLVFFRYVTDGLDLVRWEYLGASGSRGYGRVNFSDLRLAFIDAQNRTHKWEDDIEPNDLCEWAPPEVLINAIGSLARPISSPSPEL